MSKPKRKVPAAKPDGLFDRIVSILEQARSNVVRAKDQWKAKTFRYIERNVEEGFSLPASSIGYPMDSQSEIPGNSRPSGAESSKPAILHPAGGESYHDTIFSPTGRELADIAKLSPSGRELTPIQIQYPAGTELIPVGKRHPSGDELPQGFSPQLSWSGHYRLSKSATSMDRTGVYV